MVERSACVHTAIYILLILGCFFCVRITMLSVGQLTEFECVSCAEFILTTKPKDFNHGANLQCPVQLK